MIHFAGAGCAAGLLLASQQPQCGHHQQRSKDVLDPGESFQQRNTRKNEDPAHDDGAQYSQQQGLSLCSRAQAERIEHQQEDEKIINAEGQFDQVARSKLKPRLASLGMANPNPETRGEGQQKQDKQKIVAGLRGLFPATEENEVDHNQNQHYDVETYPINDRSAIEHHPMLAYDAPLKAKPPTPSPRVSALFPPSTALSSSGPPFPYNYPLLVVIPKRSEGSAVRLNPSQIPTKTYRRLTN